jgi:hypothetical protein
MHKGTFMSILKTTDARRAVSLMIMADTFGRIPKFALALGRRFDDVRTGRRIRNMCFFDGMF